MKIARVCVENDVFYAELEGEKLFRLAGGLFACPKRDGRSYDLASAKLLAPVSPSKIVCMGKIYLDHAAEMGEGIPETPAVFLKPSTSVIGPMEDIVYPSISQRLDYEGELGIVIGKEARNVPHGRAHEYILGCTCVNDVTARDIQKGELQWTRGKGFDTFCPIGPVINTEADPGNLHLVTRVNGEIKQDAYTSMLSRGIDWIICYITECMTLLPGDVIATGTPAGIGSMQRGDVVEVEIEGIGVLRNAVV